MAQQSMTMPTTGLVAPQAPGMINAQPQMQPQQLPQPVMSSAMQTMQQATPDMMRSILSVLGPQGMPAMAGGAMSPLAQLMQPINSPTPNMPSTQPKGY